VSERSPVHPGGLFHQHHFRGSCAILIDHVQRKEGMFWICRIDPMSGEEELLWSSGNVWAGTPLPSPDGQSLACKMMELTFDLHMMEGLMGP
jgi:hypothetical protein